MELLKAACQERAGLQAQHDASKAEWESAAQEAHREAQDLLSQLHLEAKGELLAAACRERADLQAQHDASKAEWEAMLARRSSDSDLFLYVVRGCEGLQTTGSVPRQAFEAEPNSALGHIYNGEWEYVRDEHGRAVVNSNVQHWPMILDWLSFETVPSHPT